MIASPKVEGLPRSIKPPAPLEVVDEPVKPLALLEVIFWQRSLRPLVSLEVIGLPRPLNPRAPLEVEG